MCAPLEEIKIRILEEKDNEAVAQLIRHTLKEFGADRPGTVYYDESTDHLYQIFQAPRSVYYIAEFKNELV